MRLRNKKTGEIADLAKRGLLKSDNDNHIIVYPEGTLKYYAYESLAELNEEWEDYAPQEPLIKYEKIRKAVRAWADVNNLAKVQYWYKDENMIAEFSWYPIYLEIRTDNLGIANRKDDNDKEFYTITELCGEEECEDDEEDMRAEEY